MKKAFTIIEIMIAVTVLGIIAAIVAPMYNSEVNGANEVNAKGNLRLLRIAVERYALDNNGIAAGYAGNDTSKKPREKDFIEQLITDGKYLSKMPVNPYNDLDTIMMLDSDDSFPLTADKSTGWIYKPSTKQLRLNYPGSDSVGTNYYDY